MTREEAKEIFLNRGFINGLFDGDKWRQSIVVISEWLEQKPCEDCRTCDKWSECECGETGHKNGTSIGYSIGECKNYEPCEDAISRQAVLEYIEASEADLGHDPENESVCQDIKALPSVNPQQDTVHFDFELYEEGLQCLPKDIVKVLDKIRGEIDELDVLRFSSGERIYKDEVLDIIEKYKAESEEVES